MDEKELLERSIYLEKTTALSRFEVMKKQTLLDIDFLTNSILRKKYLIGEDIPATEVAKIESLAPAFRHLRDNMLAEDKDEYLAEIAVEEQKLAKLKEYLAELEEEIKKSKARLADLERGVLPGPKRTSEEESEDKSKEDEEEPEFPVAGKDDKKDEVDALLGGKDGETPSTTEDKKDEEEPEFPTAEEDKNRDAIIAAMEEAAKDGPTEVGSVVKPKEKLWVKIARVVGGVAGLLALLGVKVNYDRSNTGTYQRSNQQQPWKPIATVDPVKPLTPMTNLPEPRPVAPYTPSTPAEPEVTPTPVDPTPVDPTPVTPTPVTPTPVDPTPQDEFVQPKLAPGVTIMNMEDGVERTNSGDSYVHSDEGTRRGDHVDLDRDSEGHGLVTEEQLAPQTPAPAIPQTGQEQSYEQFMDNATPEEARVVNESIAGVDWEALMAEEEAGLTLTR